MSEYSREEMYFYIMLIERTDVTFEKALEWAYAQYDENGALSWVEEIILQADSRGVVQVIYNEFGILNKVFEAKKLIGETAKLYGLKSLVLRKIFDYLYDYGYFEKEVSESFKIVFNDLENALADYEFPDKFRKEIEHNMGLELEKYSKYGTFSYSSHINS